MDRQLLAKLRAKCEGKSNLFKWRTYRRMTLEDASEASGSSVGAISAMERETQGFSKDSLKGLADAYGTTIGALFDVDPFEAHDLLMMWAGANDGQKNMMVKIARGVLTPEED